MHVIARGSPGMSGADLANLVNEAALFAVRNGSHQIHMRHFDEARDRVLLGLKREAIAMSEQDKELTAYHEGGHAVLAALLPTADPVHKVTILPTGMALGATHQLPEERHHVRRDYLEDRIAVALGGRAAESTVYGITSSGASNDLQVATQLARKMVREWGMSDRIGPMAWGSEGQVFLGEDLMHTRDYSDDTARVIDEEIESLLHQQDERCRQVLLENRKGLDLIARALIEHETIDGREVDRLLAIGAGKDPAEFPAKHARRGVPRRRPVAGRLPVAGPAAAAPTAASASATGEPAVRRGIRCTPSPTPTPESPPWTGCSSPRPSPWWSAGWRWSCAGPGRRDRSPWPAGPRAGPCLR